MRRNAIGTGQFPGPRAVAGRLGGKRADRTQINDVARHLEGDGRADIGADAGMLTPAGGAKLPDPRNLGAKTHATGAVDAARHLGFNQRTDVLFGNRALDLDIT